MTFPTLFKHQLEGIEFLRSTGGKALLCFDPGLGKTATVISFLQGKKTLVVCPASTKYSWADQIYLFTDKTATIALHDPSPTKKDIERMQQWNIFIFKNEPPETYDFLIVSYDSLNKILPISPTAIVIDECHNITNYESKRAIAISRAAINASYIIGLSGTPLKNRPSEFYFILNMIAPHEFHSFHNYARQYCNADKRMMRGRMVFDTSGASNLEELHNKIKPFFFRLTKEQVNIGLPSIVKETVTIPINDSIYRLNLKSASKKPAFEAIAQLRQCIAPMKAFFLRRIILESQKPMVIFYHHRSFASQYNNHYPKIDGSVTGIRRADIIQRFQSGAIPVLLCATKAAGEGVTLTAAKTLVIAERMWTMADEEQAIARAHRIGLRHDLRVIVVNAEGTIDELIDSIVERKRGIISELTENKLVKQIWSEVKI